MADVLFGPEIRHLYEKNDADSMRTFCEELHPATVATALEGEFEVEEAWKILELTSIQNQADIFEYFPIEWQVEMAEGIGRPRMAKLIEQMSSDDRADLLQRLNPPVADALLRLVDEANRRDIASLVKYPDNTAGSLMTTEYAWLPENITVGEAIDRLRLQAPNSETIYYIYVLDDRRKLIGVVSLRELIMAARDQIIRNIMEEEEEVLRVLVTDDPEHVAQEIAKYDLLAVPVVDDENRLVGIITHDDVIDVVVEEATEDVHRMGAVDPIEENYLEADFLTVWRSRALWMSLFFIAEMVTIHVIGLFEDTIRQLVILSLFIPLCISTGGNSGAQAATLITRALALGQVNVREWLMVLRHELLMGLALGLTLGVIGFVGAIMTPGDRQGIEWWELSLVIGQAVTAICLWGTLVGSMLPLGFKQMGIDPGIASTPFVATVVDLTGIVIYFLIAQAYLGHLLT